MVETDIKFALVEPLVITDVEFSDTLNELPEPFSNTSTAELTALSDPAAVWSAATNYALAARVRYQHSIYQRAVAGTTATPPPDDPTNWVFVSKVNRWKMLDASNSTQTIISVNGITNKASASFWILLGAGRAADTVVFDHLDASVVQLTCWNSGLDTQVYSGTRVLTERAAEDWWDYFFRPLARKTSAVFQNIPLTSGMALAFTVQNNTEFEVARIGTLVIGRSYVLGEAQVGARAGIVDYSTKTADSFGNFNVVQRGFSKRMSVTVESDATTLDASVLKLINYRATPAMWLGTGNQFTTFLMYGYYRNFEYTVKNFKRISCTFDIEGLT